jgi:hypothetical protein
MLAAEIRDLRLAEGAGTLVFDALVEGVAVTDGRNVVACGYECGFSHMRASSFECFTYRTTSHSRQ